MYPQSQKKLEKLASAVYLLTSFFADAEPLKWKLRALSADLVSAGQYLKDNHASENTRAKVEIRDMVEEVLSQLEVAKNATLISPTNHTLIAAEFHNLLNILGLPKGFMSSGDGAILSSNFFAPELGTRVERVEEREETRAEYIKDKKTSDLLDFPAGRDFRASRQNYSKRQSASETDGEARSLKDFSPVSVKKNSRRSIIINLLKRKKEIMIKDVSPLISGCSEKTIQRELLSMVDAGILKKVGEKRWSRYSLL
jgi:hypothetical protein